MISCWSTTVNSALTIFLHQWMFRDGFIDFTADEDGHNATCEKINAIKTKNGLIAFMTMRFERS